MINAEESTSASTSDGNKSILDVLKASQRSDPACKRSVAQILPHDEHNARIIAKKSEE